MGSSLAAVGIATRPGRDEAREIVDMAVGVVVQQAGAEPDHALEAEVVEQALLDLFARQACCGWG